MKCKRCMPYAQQSLVCTRAESEAMLYSQQLGLSIGVELELGHWPPLVVASHCNAAPCPTEDASHCCACSPYPSHVYCDCGPVRSHKLYQLKNRHRRLPEVNKLCIFFLVNQTYKRQHKVQVRGTLRSGCPMESQTHYGLFIHLL